MQYVSDAFGYAITSKKYSIVRHNAGLPATGSGGLYHFTGNEPYATQLLVLRWPTNIGYGFARSQNTMQSLEDFLPLRDTTKV